MGSRAVTDMSCIAVGERTIGERTNQSRGGDRNGKVSTSKTHCALSGVADEHLT